MSAFEDNDDAYLIAACRRGEGAAWDALVARYERLVYTVPLRYGLTPAEAEDVFQSVWLALLENLEELEQPERVSAWLVTTARRASWDRRRGGEHQRTVTVEPELLAEQGEEWMEDAEEVVARFESQQRIQDALAQLGARCRRLLHYLYGDRANPSYEEIAASMEMAVGSVGPTRARCLKKLKQLLEEDNG